MLKTEFKKAKNDMLSRKQEEQQHRQEKNDGGKNFHAADELRQKYYLDGIGIITENKGSNELRLKLHYAMPVLQTCRSTILWGLTFFLLMPRLNRSRDHIPSSGQHNFASSLKTLLLKRVGNTLKEPSVTSKDDVVRKEKVSRI